MARSLRSRDVVPRRHWSRPEKPMTAKRPTPCLGILAAILMLGIPSAPAGAQAQNNNGLAVERVYSTVGRCGTAAAGDLDGDGDNDLAVAEGDSTAISLWWK